MSQFGTININGRAYDLDDLDMDDVEAVEDLCPHKRKVDDEWLEEPTPFGELNFGRSRVQKALAWVILRREDPALAFEDMGKIKLVSFAQPDEEVPDTGPPDEGGTTTENGSEPADSGSQLSVVNPSTPG